MIFNLIAAIILFLAGFEFWGGRRTWLDASAGLCLRVLATKCCLESPYYCSFVDVTEEGMMSDHWYGTNKPAFTLPTTVGGGGKTFRCEHLTVGNVQSVRCGVCGELEQYKGY